MRRLGPRRILLILFLGTVLSTILGIANYYGGVLWLFRNPLFAAGFGTAVGFLAAFIFVMRMGKGPDDDYR